MNNETIVTVAEVMTQEFILIDGLATVYKALVALEAKSVRCLIVEKRHDADALGFISSSRCTVEENYLMQKLARAVFDTNNIHQCAAT